MSDMYDTWLAVSELNESWLKKLVKRGARVDTDMNGFTLLMLNAKTGNSAIAKILIQAGCPVNATDNSGDTALHLAIYHRNFEVACELVKLGANVNMKNKFFATPLELTVVRLTHIHYQVAYKIPKYSQLGEKNSYFLNSRSMGNIGKAVRSYEDSYYELRNILVKTLLDAGADINVKHISNNCTPIQTAIHIGNFELVKIFMEAGADINHQNSIGATALHDAVYCCKKEIVDLLLSHGASVVAKSTTGNTPLHWALMLANSKSFAENYATIVTKLLEFGSDLNDSNADGRTPFHILLRDGDVNTVKLCVESYNADMTKVDANGLTVLHYAVYNRDQNVMKLVLESTPRIAVNPACKNGWTALHIASKESRSQTVLELIARGADVNAKTKDGKTALFLGILESPESTSQEYRKNILKDLKDERKVIELLLEHGTDLNQKILQGEAEKTILKVALQRQRYTAAHIIIMHAAKVEAITKRRLFDDYNLRVIEEDEITKMRYTDCQDELKTMGNAEFESTSITHLSLLCRPEDEVVRYVRNKDLVKEMEANNCWRDYYQYYGLQFKEKFDAAIRKRDMFEEAYDALSEVLQFVLPEKVAFAIICKLSEADVEVLIKSVQNLHI